jgi:TBC domain-containing protein kinase-like protein
MIIAERLLGCTLWPGVKLSQCLRKVLSLIHTENSVFERLSRENNCFRAYEVFKVFYYYV